MALGKRSRNIYDPSSTKPFKVSRSKIDLFRRCPRCFYLDRRLGVGRVPGPPFLINSATDTLLKKEFDSYREIQAPHPLMVEHRINAIPFQHPELDAWRANFTGVQVHHAETNLTITGAIDDVWITPAGRLLVVDYKSTSTTKPITLKGKWKESYKRQMEVYQWLLRQNGFDVSDIGYFSLRQRRHAARCIQRATDLFRPTCSSTPETTVGLNQQSSLHTRACQPTRHPTRTSSASGVRIGEPRSTKGSSGR